MPTLPEMMTQLADICELLDQLETIDQTVFSDNVVCDHGSDTAATLAVTSELVRLGIELPDGEDDIQTHVVGMVQMLMEHGYNLALKLVAAETFAPPSPTAVLYLVDDDDAPSSPRCDERGVRGTRCILDVGHHEDCEFES